MNRQTTKTEIGVDPVEARKLDLVVSNIWFTGIVSVFSMMLCALLMRNTAQFEAMLVWVLANAIFVTVRWLFIFKPFTKLSKPSAQEYKNTYLFLLASWLGSGLLWGVGSYLFLPQADESALFVTFIIIVTGMTTGNLPNFSSSTLSGMFFIYPSILGLTIKCYEYGYYTLVAILLVYFVYITVVLRRLTRVIGHAISVDVQNEALLNQVTIEKEKAETAKDTAEALSQEKTRFLAAASHDLRQPLNSLGLFLYSLRRKFTAHDQDKAEDLTGAENAFRALRDLFASLLEISRFEDGAINVDLKNVSVSDTIETIVEELQSAANNKGLRLVYQPTDAIDTTVITDPALLSRILRNLIDNAIKFTNDGSVTIEQAVNDDQLCISVKDTGIGIPGDELSNIFDEYHQIANKRRNRREGIGLGLSIVKKMSKLLGHSVTVESVYGKGSCFSITLPITSSGQIIKHESEEELSFLYGVQALVVDDEQDVLLGMTAVLESWGCEAQCVETLEQAVEKFERAEPDIILCDFRLHQNRNGLQLVEHLRELFGTNTPAIIISGDRSNELKEALANTDLGLLAKPVNPSELHTMILAHLD